MKKYAVALSALSLAFLSGTATASKGEVRFLGAVTDTTCDVSVSVGGSVNNMIQLGTTTLNNSGSPVDFTLKANKTTSCNSLQDNAPVNITFSGPLTSNGLGIQSGLATDAYVEVKSKNSSTSTDNNIAIKQGSDTRTFKGSDIKGNGATFSAKIVGINEKGDFQSSLAFVVAYM
ncbi:fimbrial protein PefA [Salmonella enterica]|nr:fimbrial protein PefA [Salmonella enterica subsp. enterica serovar Litchfield]EHL2886935.1 fimbrial protein PefA [Salmonella enterica]